MNFSKIDTTHHQGRVRIISLGLLLCALFFFGYQSWKARRLWNGYLVDDAYISMRYARNWANGNGIVWQSGDRVEGYTNFLQVSILALGLRLGIKGETAARSLGLLTGVGSIILVFILSRRLQAKNAESWPIGFGALVLSTLPAFAVWTYSGLETPLFIFLCLLAILSLHESLDQKLPWLPIFTGVLLVGVSMTRPDGILLAACIVFIGTIYTLNGDEEQRRELGHKLVPVMVIFILGYGAYFIWRW